MVDFGQVSSCFKILDFVSYLREGSGTGDSNSVAGTCGACKRLWVSSSAPWRCTRRVGVIIGLFEKME